MPTVSFDDVLGLDDEFDPLMADDLEIDQEDMDDDNPLDTVDYPTMRNMPQSMQREAVYTPKRQGGVESAVLELLDHNPGRRPVLLSIMGLCRGGCAASRVAEHVEAAQASNRSVYAPMTLCRMLERAGALTLEMPEAAEPHEDVEAGVAFLEIKERVDPVWRTTEEGSALYERLTQGSAFRDIVLDEGVPRGHARRRRAPVHETRDRRPGGHVRRGEEPAAFRRPFHRHAGAHRCAGMERARVASDRSGTCDAACGGSSRRCEEGGEPCLRKPSTWLRS